MASKKQFHKLELTGYPPPGRNSTLGGTIIGDYVINGMRTIVIEMPKVEKKAPTKKRQKPTTGANSGRLGTPVEAAAEVTHGA